MAGLFRVVKLGGPHLVLAYVSDDNGIIIQTLVQFFNQHFWGNLIFQMSAGKWMIFLHCQNVIAPFLILFFVRCPPLLYLIGQQWQGPAEIAADTDISVDDFIDFHLIDIEMDNPGIWRKIFGIAGHAVVETAADGQQQVAFHDGHVSCI